MLDMANYVVLRNTRIGCGSKIASEVYVLGVCSWCNNRPKDATYRYRVAVRLCGWDSSDDPNRRGEHLCQDKIAGRDGVSRLAELLVNDFRGEIDGGVIVVQMRFEFLPDRLGINDSDMIRVLGDQ